MFFALLLALLVSSGYECSTCSVAARPRLLPWRRFSQEMPTQPVVGARVEDAARVEPTPREKPSPETPDVAPVPEQAEDASAEAESDRRPWRPFRPHGPDPPEPVPRPDGRLLDRVMHAGGSLLSFGSGMLAIAALTPKLILAAEVLGLLLFVAVIYRVVRR